MTSFLCLQLFTDFFSVFPPLISEALSWGMGKWKHRIFLWMAKYSGVHNDCEPLEVQENELICEDGLRGIKKSRENLQPKGTYRIERRKRTLIK